jgi:hypothetical protein
MMQIGMPLVYPPVGPMDQLPFVPPQMAGVPGQVPQYMVPLHHALPPQQQYVAPPGAYPNGPSGNNNRPMRGNPDSYGPPVYQQPPPVPPYAVRPSAPVQQQQQQGGWQQPLTVDILGLADKAAYAVQALASQNHPGMPPVTMIPGMPPVNMMRPPPSGYPGVPNGYPGVPPNAYGQPPMTMPQHVPGAMPDSNNNNNNNGPKGGRRRTTAKMQELPVMVQYAVQVRPTKRLLFVGNSCVNIC